MVDADAPADVPVVSKNRRYRKDKPWDTDDIDHWKMDKFEPGDMKSHLLDESSFATLFPKYREKYLQQVMSLYLYMKYECSLTLKTAPLPLY